MGSNRRVGAGLTLLGKWCLIGVRSHVSGGKKAEGNGCASSLVNSYSLLLLRRLKARPNQTPRLPMGQHAAANPRGLRAIFLVLF